MSISIRPAQVPAPETLAFYRQALDLLIHSGVPFLIGGAYGLECYTGIQRHTKDLDVFVRPPDCPRVLDMLAAAGYRTDLTFPHWLGKAFRDGDFIDVIFGSGNGVCTVDDVWFARAEPADVMGRPVRLCPVEEMIWSKAYIMERERYDGADIAHLLRVRGHRLDWRHLLDRFGPHWPVLFNHLILFEFIYPGEREQIPDWILEDLTGRLHRELNRPPPPRGMCQGTLLSRSQYLIDIEHWGYPDARLRPQGRMTPKDVETWTAPIRDDKGTPL